MGTKVVGFALIAGALSGSWTADADYSLIDFISTAASAAAFGPDPSVSGTTGVTPTSADQVDYLVVRSTNNHSLRASPMKIPIQSGKKYYFAAASATRLLLYLDPPEVDIVT